MILIKEAHLFVVEIRNRKKYETFFFLFLLLKLLSGEGRSLTLHKYIREVPKLKA